jgi:hypothetical protein
MSHGTDVIERFAGMPRTCGVTSASSVLWNVRPGEDAANEHRDEEALSDARRTPAGSDAARQFKHYEQIGVG